METLIYYCSKTNHSKNYASSLSNRIPCDSFSYKEMSYKKMKDYDTIIFIGPVHNNKISKIDKFLKFYEKIKDKNLIVIAVGMQPSSSERREGIILANGLNFYHIRLYELQGGFDASKLNPITRKVMKIGLKAAMEKDPLLKANQDRIDNLMKFPLEYNDDIGIDRILEKIRLLENKNKII